MFIKQKVITSSTNLMSYYIEGRDTYNSKLLRELTNPKYNRMKYVIDTFEYRPDLIAQEVYGSTDFQGLLMFQCKLKIEDYVKGKILYLIPGTLLSSIIDNL
jgi:hypothetical protein